MNYLFKIWSNELLWTWRAFLKKYLLIYHLFNILLVSLLLFLFLILMLLRRANLHSESKSKLLVCIFKGFKSPFHLRIGLSSSSSTFPKLLTILASIFSSWVTRICSISLFSSSRMSLSSIDWVFTKTPCHSLSKHRVSLELFRPIQAQDRPYFIFFIKR